MSKTKKSKGAKFPEPKYLVELEKVLEDRKKSNQLSDNNKKDIGLKKTKTVLLKKDVKFKSKDDMALPNTKVSNFDEITGQKAAETESTEDKSFLDLIEDKLKVLEKTKIGQFLSRKWEAFKKTKIGQILLSNSFNYALSLGGGIVAISGLFTPLSPVIIALATCTFVGIGIKAVKETLRIHSLHKLYKENNLLVQNRNAKSQQDYILSLEPNLINSLKDELEILNVKKVSEDKYKIKSHKAKSAAMVLLGNIGGFVHTAVGIAHAAVSTDVISILKSARHGVTLTHSLIKGTLSEREKNILDAAFKLNINEEYKKSDTPHYQNLAQLEEITTKQIIQTVALKELLKDEKYWNIKANDKLIKDKFKKIKDNIKNEIIKNGMPIFLKQNKLDLDHYKASYLKDLGRVLDPFYHTKKDTQAYSPLAEAIQNNKEENHPVKIKKKRSVEI